MSSMIAELYSAVSCTTDMWLLQSIARDFGVEMTSRFAVGSTAATGCMRREGLGNANHGDIQWLWIQQETRSGRVPVACAPSACLALAL